MLWQTARGTAHTGLLVLASCLAAALAFDVLAYFFLPASLTTFAPDYRQPPPTPQHLRGYHRADPVLGFDIAPGQSGRHLRRILGHGSVPASSNDLGCRDPRNLADILGLPKYTYFAGDSFTWGFSREERTFPSVYERASGNPALNCGVGGTGQWHQLQKFRRIARAIGGHPRLVVIGLFANDMVDDLWHPQFAIVRGEAVLRRRAVQRPGARGVTLAGEEPAGLEYGSWFWRTLDAGQAYRSWESGFSLRRRFHLWRWEAQARYSLLYNICRRGLGLFRQPPKGNNPPANLHDAGVHMAGLGPDYLQDPYTRPHREALRAWARDAGERGYRLAVVLIPDRHLLGSERSRGWRTKMRRHLAALGVPLLDFAGYILAEGLRTEDLYWRHDNHLSEDGNRVLGEWLARELP